MENFLGKLSRWMTGETAPDAANHDDVQVAAAALLIHAMRVDDEDHPEEIDRVHAVLKARFQLEDAELTTLINEGKAQDDEAVDLYRFTRTLTSNLDLQGRLDIVRMLWEVAAADGEIHEFESNLVWRVAELIGVTREDRIRLRQEVLAAPNNAA